MPQKKKTNKSKLSWFSHLKSSPDNAPPSVWAKRLGAGLIVVALAATTVLALHELEDRVLSGRVGAAPTQTHIRLASTPVWMPQSLEKQIADSFLPRQARYYDLMLTDQVRRRAETNPWVARVIRVEKTPVADGQSAVVEVDAIFRMPVAMVHAANGMAYISADGVRLPAEQTPKWAVKTDSGVVFFISRFDLPAGQPAKKVHFVLIDGAAAPAPAVGEFWPGADIAAGLRLVELIRPKPYAWQITTVDVRNHGWRVSRHEPQLRMHAQIDRSGTTDILFGRFPNPAGDFNVSPARKLSYLDDYAADHDGKLAGLNRYIDLRHDEPQWDVQ